jgi:hypothetical protein
MMGQAKEGAAMTNTTPTQQYITRRRAAVLTYLVRGAQVRVATPYGDTGDGEVVWSGDNEYVSVRRWDKPGSPAEMYHWTYLRPIVEVA